MSAAVTSRRVSDVSSAPVGGSGGVREQADGGAVVAALGCCQKDCGSARNFIGKGSAKIKMFLFFLYFFY